MSKRKARLIRSDNFFINQYYNTYDYSKPLLKANSKNHYSFQCKKILFSLVNERSLLYSSVYKKLRPLNGKKKGCLEISNYPLYLKKFLTEYSDTNYYNAYTINITTQVRQKNLFIYTALKKTFLYREAKTFLYRKQSSFFNSTYKYKISLPFEKEDQNKLVIRKYNLRKKHIL